MIPPVGQVADSNLPPEGLGMRLCRYRAFFFFALASNTGAIERTRSLSDAG